VKIYLGDEIWDSEGGDIAPNPRGIKISSPTPLIHPRAQFTNLPQVVTDAPFFDLSLFFWEPVYLAGPPNKPSFFELSFMPGSDWTHKFGTDHDWRFYVRGYNEYGFETQLGDHLVRLWERRDTFEVTYLSVKHFVPLAPLGVACPQALQMCVDFVHSLSRTFLDSPLPSPTLRSRFDLIDDLPV
jgi:hypothetical protein